MPAEQMRAVLSGAAAWSVVEGDSASVLKQLPSGCVDAVVSDPPAGIGFMGLAFDHNRGGRDAWIAWLAGIMAEARRCTKPGGHALVWALPRTSHWTGMALEQAGWQVRDVITHLQSQGFPKSRSLLKPASEHWILCRAPGPLQPLQIDACRVPTGESTIRAGSQPFSAGGVRRDNGRAAPGHRDVTGSTDGRWPSNAVFSHVGGPDGCQSAGVRRVRGSNVPGPGGQAGLRENAWGWRAAPVRVYNDADGYEEVSAWTCVGPSETVAETFTLPDGSRVDPMAAGFRLLVAALEDVQARLRHSHNADTAPCDAMRRDLAALGAPDFQGDCPACRHSCDAHARLLRDAARESPPQLADALESVLDLGRSPLHSRLCPSDARLSSSDGSRGESRHGGTAASKNGRDHGCASLPALVGHTAHIPPSEQPLNVQRGSTPSNNSAHSGAAIGPTPCRSTCSGAGFRLLSRLVLHCASWYLPLHCATQTIAQAGCPIKALDEQAGPRPVSGSARNGRPSTARPQSIFGGPRPQGRLHEDVGSASRFFPTFTGAPDPEDAVPFRYVPKASRRERDAGLDHVPASRGGAEQFDSRWREGTGEMRQPVVRNTHPTVKPQSLMSWLVRLVTPPLTGVVLDPFCGSGSTGVACMREGVRFIGVEMSAHYASIARARVAHASAQQQERADAS